MVTKKPKIPDKVTVHLSQERLAELMTHGRIDLLMPLGRPVVLTILIEARP